MGNRSITYLLLHILFRMVDNKNSCPKYLMNCHQSLTQISFFRLFYSPPTRPLYSLSSLFYTLDKEDVGPPAGDRFALQVSDTSEFEHIILRGKQEQFSRVEHWPCPKADVTKWVRAS
jgi:hypothetical protein